MPLSKVFRVLAVSAAGLVALAGLSYQTVSVSGSNDVGQDFIVLSQTAGSNLDRSLVASSTEPQTLSDWEFTARVRPIKCRFVN